MLENSHLFKFLFLIDWAGKTNESLWKTNNALQDEGGTELTHTWRKNEKEEEETWGNKLIVTRLLNKSLDQQLTQYDSDQINRDFQSTMDQLTLTLLQLWMKRPQEHLNTSDVKDEGYTSETSLLQAH